MTLLSWLACATTTSWEISVPIGGTVGASCLEASLADEPDVVDLVQTSDDSVAFRLHVAGLEGKDAPAVAVTQSTAFDETELDVSTSYASSLRRHEAAHRALTRRAGELATALAWDCAGRRVTLGPSHPCGRGEGDELCVEARPAP